MQFIFIYNAEIVSELQIKRAIYHNLSYPIISFDIEYKSRWMII